MIEANIWSERSHIVAERFPADMYNSSTNAWKNDLEGYFSEDDPVVWAVKTG
jgi:hypothetical protein